MGANKVICFQPPCGAFVLICLRTWEDHVYLWTPGRSPLRPCQSLKHLTTNHCSDSGAAGYHVSFAFNLATAVSSSASGPLPAISVTLDWLQKTFFWSLCFSHYYQGKVSQLLFPPSMAHGTLRPSVCLYSSEAALDVKDLTTASLTHQKLATEVRIIVLKDKRKEEKKS